MPDIYADGGYLGKNPSWHEQDAAWKVDHIARMLDRHRITPASVIDIGCGTGEILRLLSERLGGDTRCHGYEVSPQVFERAATKQNERLTFTLGDALATRAPRADLAMAMDVIEHVDDCYGFARAMRDKAEWKLLHIPLDLSASSVARRRPLRFVRERYGHVHYFTRETALAMLRDAGHDVIDDFYTATALEVAEHGWRARVMGVPRRALMLLGTGLAARVLGGFSLMVLTR